MPTPRTEALAHGESSWGAKYMVRGFTRSPQTDLLYALGFPSMRRLVDGHPDDALPADALKEKILSPYGPDIPAASAARRVRTLSAFVANPDGSWRKEAHEAFEDASPFTAKSAREFILGHLAKRGMGANQHDIALTLEALVGADAVCSAIAEALEARKADELARHSRDLEGWGALAGIILLRTSKAVGDALFPRLEKFVARGLAAPEPWASAVALDGTLHGHRRDLKRAGKLWHSDLVWWSEAPLDLLAKALAKVEVNKWSFSVEPRLAMLAPDAAIDLYRKRWSVLKDADDHRRLVEWFGEIVHPGIAPLIAEMAEKSKAKKAARAWLDANPGGSAGAKAPAKEAKEAKASKASKAKEAAPARPALPPLDPAKIAAQFDEAVAGNDWPDFFELNPEDVLHGMRIVAARSGKDWGVAIERLQGDDPGTLVTRTWLFGSRVDRSEGYSDKEISFAVEDGEATGPQGALAVKGKKKFEAIARAYHAHFGGGLWPDPEATAGLLGFEEPPAIVVVSDAFAHVPLASGKKKQVLPSASRTYASLAKAVATGDGSLFEAGKSNV